MALSLPRPKHKSLSNPSLIRLFSSSSDVSPKPPQIDDVQQQQQPPPPPQQQSSFSSYFSEVKSRLKHQQQGQNPTTKTASLEEIRKNLSEFRSRSLPPSETSSQQPPQQQQSISFHELYKRNVLAKSQDANSNNVNGDSSSNTSNSKPLVGKFSFDAIRESLRKLNTDKEKKGAVGGDRLLSSSYKSNLRLRPVNENQPRTSSVIGGTEGLPVSVFGKEMKEEGESVTKGKTSTEFVKIYSYGELGEKLKSLRPEVKRGEKGWFSLEELNERLRKLRELEENETKSQIVGVPLKGLRETLVTLKALDEEKLRKNSIQRLNILSHIGATPSFMLEPPKEHLVEKYFHPDNMSSEEKMKLELAKVREEFKMSESDCGSARVQVAQLTTKIKHLSSVLHKKDKHSRKGLIGMVQRRKKLLKYLRRTDWDSYCFVLDKLGLRDNVDQKYQTRH